ncbi:MAG TPA: NYN domain-containing protein, partial [Ktedonobacteraceae bacterium]
LALMLDWENVKISLLDVLKKMPAAQSQALRQRLAGSELAARLLEAASRYGQPRQKWAVANWDLATFAGDQAALKRARYMPDLSGEQKDDASDHVLRERIHYVLREQPDIDTYIIGTGDGDFGEVIKTLQEKGKRVVLWATKTAISSVYKHHLKGPDSIQVEWLEDIVFGKEASA